MLLEFQNGWSSKTQSGRTINKIITRETTNQHTSVPHCTMHCESHTHTHTLTVNENHFPITTAWGSLYMHLPWETSMHSHRPQWDKETHIIPSFMDQYHMFTFPPWIMHKIITVQYTTPTYKSLHVSMWVEWEDLSVSCTTLANNNFTCMRAIAGQSVFLSKTCFSKWARACIGTAQ